MSRLLDGGASFKVTEINNVKWENLLQQTERDFKQPFETNFNKPHTIKNLNISNILIVLLFGS